MHKSSRALWVVVELVRLYKSCTWTWKCVNLVGFSSTVRPWHFQPIPNVLQHRLFFFSSYCDVKQILKSQKTICYKLPFKLKFLICIGYYDVAFQFLGSSLCEKKPVFKTSLYSQPPIQWQYIFWQTLILCFSGGNNFFRAVDFATC